MADYLIGDIQGCYKSLQSLLKKIDFSLDRDKLFFLGDVINRGSQSLETLAFIQAHHDNASMVLGNHDFHLLACTIGNIKSNRKDTFDDIINAKNASDLLDFLIQQPLVIERQEALMVHAGIPPNWDKARVSVQAQLVENHLKSENLGSFLTQMYDDKPDKWHENLDEMQQCRYTINAFMRMRFCQADGRLEFTHKMNSNQAPNGFKAWFEHENRALKNTDIFFGHWSTLDDVNRAHIFPMDHGCIWGGKLSAIRLSDKQIFSIDC